MSSKGTILNLPCCHIYDDFIGTNSDRTLTIEVSYGEVSEDSDTIEVEKGSEFANLMRYLLKGKTEDELLKASKGES